MKPWEKPQLIKQEDRWVVVVPVGDRTCRHLDVTEDMNGWINRETAPIWEALEGLLKPHRDGDIECEVARTLLRNRK